MASDDLKVFIDRADRRKESAKNWAGDRAIEQIGVELDTTMNFRLNSKLKHEFDYLCKINHTTMARELKRFMTEAIRIQRLI